MSKKNIIFLVGCLISLGLIAYFTRNVDWAEFRAAIRGFELIWLVPGFAAFYVSMYLRATRWGLLFRPHYRISGRQAFPPLMVGFAFNSILPGRVGEFVRSFHIGRSQKTGMPTAMATVVAERILDGVTLLALLAISFTVLPEIDPEFKVQVMGIKDPVTAEQINKGAMGLSLLSTLLVIFVITFMIPRVQLAIIRRVRRMEFLPPKVRQLAERAVEQFARGFHALKEPLPMARIVFESALLWVLVGVSNLAIARGFGLAMNLPQSLALVTLIAFFIMVPAVPGYWGLFEAGTIFSLYVMGITSDRSLALAYAITIHLVQYVPIVVIGLFFAWRAQIHPSAHPSDEVIHRPSQA